MKLLQGYVMNGLSCSGGLLHSHINMLFLSLFSIIFSSQHFVQKIYCRQRQFSRCCFPSFYFLQKYKYIFILKFVETIFEDIPTPVFCRSV